MQPAESIQCYLYIHDFKTDHLVLDNQLVGTSLRKIHSFSLSAVISCSQLFVSENSSFHFSMSIGVVIVQVLCRQLCYCGTIDVTCHFQETPTQQNTSCASHPFSLFLVLTNPQARRFCCRCVLLCVCACMCVYTHMCASVASLQDATDVYHIIRP